VLEIARLEGRTVEFDADSEPLEPALDDALTALKPELACRDVTIDIVGRGALPSVTADGRGLRSVLTHLLHNAIVFSPEGGRVEVTATVDNGAVDILIRDEGDGVDPAELHRLMAPFEQGENALTRKAEGAGLGLPIADMTCAAMGGRLRLSSAPGEGLTAEVRLPAG